MASFRKYIDVLYWVMSCFFAFSLAFPSNLSVWVFTLWGFLFLGRKIVDFIDGKRNIIAPRKRRYLPSLLLFVLSLLGLLSAFWAEDPSLVTHKIFGPKLSLFILPLFALLDDDEVDFDMLLRFYILGNVVFIAYSLLLVCYKYWVMENIELHRDFLRYFTEICNRVVHRTYSGVNILLSYVALFYMANKGTLTKRFMALGFVYLFVSLAFLFLNNSRTITMEALILLVVFCISYLTRGNKRVFYSLLVGMVLLGSIFFLLPSRSKEMLNSDHFIEKLEQDPRARIWPCTMDLAMEKPWMGYGVDNVIQPLSDKYLTCDFLEGAAQQYGPHNEYLNTWLQMGVLGLLLFLSLLVAIPWSVSKERWTFALFYTLVFAFAFLTESMLDRYNGCLTFAFFVTMMSKRECELKRYNPDGKAVWIAFLLLMLLPTISFAATVAVDRMSKGTSIIRKGIFDQGAVYAVQSRDVVSFIHDARCKSSFSVAYCDLPSNERLQFKIDCLTSEDFDGSTVKIIAEEDMPDGSVRPTESLYDLGRKEEWQELSVEVSGKRTIVIYIFGDAKLSFDDLKGKAFFKNPRFVTN